jgi:hypothetical protein
MSGRYVGLIALMLVACSRLAAQEPTSFAVRQ